MGNYEHQMDIFIFMSYNPEKLIEIRDRANEKINTKKHLKKRLINSAGHRFAEQIN